MWLLRPSSGDPSLHDSRPPLRSAHGADPQWRSTTLSNRAGDIQASGAQTRGTGQAHGRAGGCTRRVQEDDPPRPRALPSICSACGCPDRGTCRICADEPEQGTGQYGEGSEGRESGDDRGGDRRRGELERARQGSRGVPPTDLPSRSEISPEGGVAACDPQTAWNLQDPL